MRLNNFNSTGLSVPTFQAPKMSTEWAVPKRYAKKSSNRNGGDKSSHVVALHPASQTELKPEALASLIQQLAQIVHDSASFVINLRDCLKRAVNGNRIRCLVVLGVGSPSTTLNSRLQIALALALAKLMHRENRETVDAWRAKSYDSDTDLDLNSLPGPSVYLCEPALSEVDRELCDLLGINVLGNCKGRYNIASFPSDSSPSNSPPSEVAPCKQAFSAEPNGVLLVPRAVVPTVTRWCSSCLTVRTGCTATCCGVTGSSYII